MKQLRLLATQALADGAFEWQLAESIKLEPYAKVALQQATMSVRGGQFVVVAGDNDRIYFRTAGVTAGSIQRTATINPGNYDKNGLILAVEEAMNRAMAVSDVTNIGFQWAVRTVNGSVDIAFDRNDPAVITPQTTTGGTFAGTTLTKTAIAGMWNCWSVSTRPFIRSCGLWSCTVDTLTAYPAVGLVASTAVANGDPANMTIGVYASAATNTYHHVSGGVDTDLLVAITANDEIGVELSGGLLHGYYERAGVTTYLGAPLLYNYNDGYFPIMSLYGAATETTDLAEHNTDPFSTAINSDVGAKRTSAVTLYFNVPSTYGAADLLGFDRSEYRLQRQVGDFIAPFTLTSTPQYLGLLVLLESMPSLQSYDSSYGGRRPILASVSAWEQANAERINYMPSTPIFLEIGNDQEQYLSNFRIRVIDAENSPIELSDGVCFTLLFT